MPSGRRRDFALPAIHRIFGCVRLGPDRPLVAGILVAGILAAGILAAGILAAGILVVVAQAHNFVATGLAFLMMGGTEKIGSRNPAVS